MKSLNGKRVFLYARVSTTEQKENGYRLIEQKKALFAFAEKNEMEIIEYFEEDFTATTFNRPIFSKMSKELIKKKIDYVLFYKWDRFTREPNGIIKVDEWLEKGIEPQSITEWVNYEDASYYIYVGFYILNAKVDNKKRSEASKDGVRGANNEGRHVNHPPIGFIRGKDPINKKKPLMKPCPIKAPLINSIFEEYATGLYTQESLRKKYSKKGIERSKSQFSNMLSNINYIGKIHVAEYKGNPAKIVNALHKPIVKEITFLKAQKVKFGRANVRLNIKKNNKHSEKLPLRGGILKCSKCGSNLTGSPSKSRNGSYHYYYHCNRKKGCKENFSAVNAHQELEKLLLTFKPSKEVVVLFSEILKDEYKTNFNHREKEVKKLSKTKIKIQEKLDSLTEKYISDSIDEPTFKRFAQKFKTEIDEINIMQSELSETNKDLDSFIDFGTQLLLSLDIYYKRASSEIKKSILGSIFSEKLVFENKKYRTTKLNDAVLLIFNYNKELQTNTNKKRQVKNNLSYSVAGTGLEPVTFGL